MKVCRTYVADLEDAGAKSETGRVYKRQPDILFAPLAPFELKGVRLSPFRFFCHTRVVRLIGLTEGRDIFLGL